MFQHAFKNTSALVLPVLCVFAVGCAHEEKKAPPPPPTPAQQAQTQMTGDRDAFVAQTQTRIDALTKFSNDLQAQSAKSEKVKGKKLSNASQDLNSLLADARKELNDVKQSAPENWVDEKRDVDQAMSRAESQYSNSVHLLQ